MSRDTTNPSSNQANPVVHIDLGIFDPYSKPDYTVRGPKYMERYQSKPMDRNRQPRFRFETVETVEVGGVYIGHKRFDPYTSGESVAQLMTRLQQEAGQYLFAGKFPDVVVYKWRKRDSDPGYAPVEVLLLLGPGDSTQQPARLQEYMVFGEFPAGLIMNTSSIKFYKFGEDGNVVETKRWQIDNDRQLRLPIDYRLAATYIA